jgi:hypothetical protein
MKEGMEPKAVNLTTLVNDKLEGWHDSDPDRPELTEDDEEKKMDENKNDDHLNYGEKENEIGREEMKMEEDGVESVKEENLDDLDQSEEIDQEVEVTCMVPFADMLNHRAPSQTKWYFDEEKRRYVVEAMENIPKGAEITRSYGTPLDNHQSFLVFGFV